MLSRLAPRNRLESYTVTMLFTQLLLNAGSLKVEHPHALLSYSYPNNLRELSHTHTHTQSTRWGITNPSPRVSVSRSRRQHGGQGSCQHLAKKDLQSQVGSRADEVLSPAGETSGGQCQGRSAWHKAAL